jgi:hypothetical protein
LHLQKEAARLKQLILSAVVILSLSLAPVPAVPQHDANPPQSLCYAFWLDGDVYTNCEGHKERVTHFADVESFAVDPNGQKLALIRHQAKVQGRGVLYVVDGKPEYYYSHSALQLIPLSGNGGGALSPLKWPMELYATCGTVLGITTDPAAVGNFAALPVLFDDLLNGGQIRIDPYRDFVCTSDRKTVVGRTDLHDSALRVGLPPQKVLPGLEGSLEIRYDVSPGGKYIAYNFSDGKVISRMCVFATDTREIDCVGEEVTHARMSVAESGDVLYETSKVGDCYYKDSYRASTKDLPGYTPSIDCRVIAYWRPGEGKPRILEWLGEDPQWISPETASTLIAWGTRSQVAR